MSQSEADPALHGGGNTLITQDVWEQLVVETQAMARYALAAGLAIPPSVICRIKDGREDSAEQPALAAVHNELAKLVAPAKPGTIRLLEIERREKGIGRYLGPIRLVRHLMVVSIFFVAAFVVLATLTDAGTASTRASDLGKGWSALAVVVYLLAAAGVGAVFAALWRVNRYVEEGTYDRTYDASYWILIALGLIAGLILALVIPLESVAGQETFSKPLLALLGGFAASAVHRILVRLVDAVESIVRGDPRDEVKAKEQQLAAAQATEKTGLAARLMTVDQALTSGSDVAVVQKQIRDLIATLAPDVPPAAMRAR